MEITFSLDFFRKHFHIPQGVRLCWCVIVKNDDEYEKALGRLGVMICNTNKVIDVVAREFVQTGSGLPLSYNAYPATVYEGDEMVFETPNGYRVNVSDTYITDLYFRSVYSEELISQPLV